MWLNLIVFSTLLQQFPYKLTAYRTNIQTLDARFSHEEKRKTEDEEGKGEVYGANRDG